MIKFIKKIKKIIKGKNKMGYEFPLFKVAQIEKTINIWTLLLFITLSRVFANSITLD